MTQLFFSICWNPEEIGAKTSEGKLASESESKQAKRESFLLLCPFYRLPAEGVAQIKGESSHFN